MNSPVNAHLILRRRLGVDDATLLRLEKIKFSLEVASKNAEMQSQQNVAILAVAMPLGAGAAVGGLVGQVPWWIAGPVLALSGLVVSSQLRGMAEAAKGLARAHVDALASVDRLMLSGGESPGDEPASNQGRA